MVSCVYEPPNQSTPELISHLTYLIYLFQHLILYILLFFLLFSLHFTFYTSYLPFLSYFLSFSFFRIRVSVSSIFKLQAHAQDKKKQTIQMMIIFSFFFSLLFILSLLFHPSILACLVFPHVSIFYFIFHFLFFCFGFFRSIFFFTVVSKFSFGRL